MSELESRGTVGRRPTRRQLMAGAALALGGLAANSRVWGQSKKTLEPAEGKSTGLEALLTYLHQEVDLPASAQRVYQVLLDSSQFAAFTRLPAQIDAEAGGAFSLFGGMIVGRIIELVPNFRIVQAWRPSHWPAGVYSVARFEFRAHESHATVILDHTGFPEGDFRGLDTGWYKRYWEPLNQFLAQT